MPDDEVPRDNWERVARLLHEEYRPRPPSPGRPSQRPWDEGLPQFYRRSNIRQIQVLLLAAHQLDREWGPAEHMDMIVGPDEFMPTEIDALARTEHESWVEYYQDNGWRLPRAGQARDDTRLRHDLLVAWDDLPEGGPDSPGRWGTRDQIRKALALLQSSGYLSRRKGWYPYERVGEVRASRLDRDLEWMTSAGTRMHGTAGDWRVTDLQGAHERTVQDAQFRAGFAHVHDDIWRRTGHLAARPAVAGERVVSPEGADEAKAGQMVVEGLRGERWLVPMPEFDLGYRRRPELG